MLTASLTCLALLPALPRSQAQNAAPTDHQRVVGLWEAQAGPSRQLRVRLRFDPNGRVVLLLPTHSQAAFQTITGAYRLEPETNPKRMTWSTLSYERRKLPDNPAIYSFSPDGNRLSILCGTPDGRRPDRFPDDPQERAARVLQFYRLSASPDSAPDVSP
jgi:uncharacterized protein (TIGR03067 family)